MAIHARSSISTFILIAISIFLGVIQNSQAQQLIHFPITTGIEGESIALEAKFENLSQQVVYMRIYFRSRGVEDYQYVEMDERTDNFVGAIPASAVKAPAMEYFILALLSNQNIISNPASNPFYAPYEITIRPKTETPREYPGKIVPTKKKIQTVDGTSITTLILSPEPDSRVNDDEVVIALSFLTEIDKKSVQVFLDDKNVTANAEITNFMVSYVPKSIAPGGHRVKLTFKNAEGQAFDPIEWNFQVSTMERFQEQKKEKLPISGRLFFDAKSEKYSNQSLSTINGGGNFSGKYGGIHYNGSVFVTSREQSDQQPRNRYLLDVGTSWIGVRLGDTNPRFNDLILWGKRVRGIEAYLKLGFFNIEFVQGETNRAVKGRLDSLRIINFNYYPIDTINVYRYGTFKQTLMGIRPSFGSGKNFQLGFNLLKVRDDTSSTKYGLSPKDNVVFGPDILFALDNHRIEFKAGAAFSLITNDISGGAMTKSDIDSIFETEIPIDPSDYEDLFILNTSTTPIDPTKLTSLAYNMQFKFNYFNNSILVQYKSIGSEYISLGNTFLRNNIQGFSISDAIRLFQNQLILNIGLDQFIDKLDNEKDDDEFTVPTDLTTFNIGISYYPRKPGLPKVSFNIKDHNRNNDLDTLNAIGNQTKDISVQLGYDFSLFNLKHTVSLGIIGSDRIDDFNPNQFNVATAIRMFTIQTKYQMPLTTTITYATNQNSMGKSVYVHSFKYNQLGIGGIYMLLNNKLRLDGGINLTSAVGNDFVEKYTDYKRVAFNFGGSYQIASNQYLTFDSSLINFDDKIKHDGKHVTYNDSIFRLRYELRY